MVILFPLPKIQNIPSGTNEQLNDVHVEEEEVVAILPNYTNGNPGVSPVCQGEQCKVNNISLALLTPSFCIRKVLQNHLQQQQQQQQNFGKDAVPQMTHTYLQTPGSKKNNQKSK